MDNMKSQLDYTSKEMLIKAALRSVKIPYYPTLIETEQEVLRRFVIVLWILSIRIVSQML